jgi:prolyl-tRNA synthetase
LGARADRGANRFVVLGLEFPLMRLSRFFLPILKETPKEAEIVSHRLMLRAGMIRQEGSGIYAWLPLGYRVLQKIQAVIREEQNRSGAMNCGASRGAMTTTARRCCA